jgi:hypothetical protein
MVEMRCASKLEFAMADLVWTEIQIVYGEIIIAGSYCCDGQWVRVKARHGGGQASSRVGKMMPARLASMLLGEIARDGWARPKATLEEP